MRSPTIIKKQEGKKKHKKKTQKKQKLDKEWIKEFVILQFLLTLETRKCSSLSTGYQV